MLQPKLLSVYYCLFNFITFFPLCFWFLPKDVFIYSFFYLIIYLRVVSEKSALFGQDNLGWETSVKLQVYIKASKLIM